MDIERLKTLAAKTALPANTPVAARRDSTGTVYIYEEISPPEYGGMGAKAFVEQLQNLGNVNTLNIHINSIGGSVIEAMGIYNALLAHPAASKVVSIDGIAASAASFIAMAGTRIVMAESAMMMVHQPWATTGGNAKALRSMADLLDRNETALVNIYQKRTKQPEAKIRSMLEAETWMTAQEAVDLNFADAVAVQDAPTQIAAKAPSILTIAAVTQRQLTESDLALASMEMALLRQTV
jgi:ATP-dependent protease ClpP protease subunit